MTTDGPGWTMASQAWERHLAAERDWWCPAHGYVSPTERQHGGRSRAFVCPRERCRHTLTNTTVDWAAYHEARAADDAPPCPSCGAVKVDEVPAGVPFRCSECSHGYGYAGAYY